MPASRYPDWASFGFPGGLAGPDPGADQDGQPVAFCSDLSPASVLGAYRRGIVPIPAASEYFRTLNDRYRRRWRRPVLGGVVVTRPQAGDRR
jgi:hypothetical protein